MILNIVVESQEFPIEVPPSLLQDAESFYRKMDHDMNGGWQMNRYWVDAPTIEQRCQIAADKCLSAIHNENTKLATMMAGYILSRMPGTVRVVVDTSGEMQETLFIQGGPQKLDA